MEVCIDSLESAKNAIDGGASRLEICSALTEGGLTPTPGILHQIKIISPIPIYAMLRVRSGNFIYSKEEMNCMLHDLKILKDHGANGFVFGALTLKDEIDVESCKKILREADPLPVTFHRAFDEAEEPLESLEILIDLGFERILTSGQKNTALEGVDLIKRLIEKAGDKIIVMPGSGITKDNILEIKKISGAKEFHASAKKKKILRSGARRVKMGATMEESYMVTDKELVNEMVELIS